jgi:hypothetical protein
MHPLNRHILLLRRNVTRPSMSPSMASSPSSERQIIVEPFKHVKGNFYFQSLNVKCTCFFKKKLYII